MSAPQYATRRYTVAPGGSVQVARASDFLTCLKASHPFKMSFDNQPRTDFEAGLTYNTEGGFTLVEIINEEADELSITLGFGRGDINDARLVLPGAIDVSGSSVQVKSGATFYAPAPVTVLPDENASVWVFAENAARKEAGLKNIGPSRVWVKHHSSYGIKGHPLDPGETIVLATTSNLYVTNHETVETQVARWEVIE